ncbi:MAG: CbiX/SirB N-terminal domain-containing protein [Chlorobiales bacterium]|nr:CbiX/SirB N-terminal domain-containing protein [Chlorobiales bacterium]
MHLFCTASRFSVTFILLILVVSCRPVAEKTYQERTDEKKIGVLLLNHGSRSERWRENLIQVEENVAEKILSIEGIESVMTSFMEHTKPSIADGLKTFDREGYSDIIVIPIFLTIGSHMFDDIPTIIGMKENPASMEKLKLENIERYIPKAKTHLAPPLDFSNILKTNALRRTLALSKNTEEEGVVLVGYGSTTFDAQWTELFENVGSYVCEKSGISDFTIAWCGHIAHYSPDSTTAAINMILEKKQRALVLPLLVSSSEQFQNEIIGGGIAAVSDHESRVRYKPDAVLPDPDLEQWIVDAAEQYAAKIMKLSRITKLLNSPPLVIIIFTLKTL